MTLWREFLQRHAPPPSDACFSDNSTTNGDSPLFVDWKKSADVALAHAITKGGNGNVCAAQTAKAVMCSYLSNMGLSSQICASLSFGDAQLLEASMQAMTANGEEFNHKALRTLKLAEKASNPELKLDCLKAVAKAVPHGDLHMREKFFSKILRNMSLDKKAELGYDGVVNQ